MDAEYEALVVLINQTLVHLAEERRRLCPLCREELTRQVHLVRGRIRARDHAGAREVLAVMNRHSCPDCDVLN
jgi:hypothetical protein